MYPVNGDYKQANLVAKPKRTEWLCDFTAKINKFYIPSFFWACYFHFWCLYRYVLASVIPGISEYWEKNKIAIEIRKNHWIATKCWLIIFRIKVPFRNWWKRADVICKFQQNLRKSRITSSLEFCVTIHCSPTVCSFQIITDEQVGMGDDLCQSFEPFNISRIFDFEFIFSYFPYIYTLSPHYLYRRIVRVRRVRKSLYISVYFSFFPFLFSLSLLQFLLFSFFRRVFIVHFLLFLIYI